MILCVTVVMFQMENRFAKLSLDESESDDDDLTEFTTIRKSLETRLAPCDEKPCLLPSGLEPAHNPRGPNQIKNWSEFKDQAIKFRRNFKKHIRIPDSLGSKVQLSKYPYDVLFDCCIPLVPGIKVGEPLKFKKFVGRLNTMITESNTDYDVLAVLLYSNPTLINNRIDLAKSGVKELIYPLYSYMAVNAIEYGILACYHTTYFFKLDLESMDILYISDPIAPDDSDPTLLQCFYYFLNIVSSENDEKESDTNTNEEQLGTERSIVKKISTLMKTRMYYEKGRRGDVYLVHDEEHRVYVVKVTDLRNTTFIDGPKHSIAEVSAYKKLNPFNLGVVPKYFWSETIGVLHFLALELIEGYHPSVKRSSMRAKIEKCIGIMAKHGVLHSSLNVHEKNVLKCVDGSIKIIDLGRAKVLE